MYVLVVNVGSTSFKYKLFDMPSEQIRIEGKIERVGEEQCPCSFSIPGGEKFYETRSIPSFAEAINYLLSLLTASDDGVICSLQQLGAVGFKVVHARGYSGVQLFSPEVIQAMKDYICVLPVHNPPYIMAIEVFKEILPDIPMVGLFETAFHQTMPEFAYTYSIPHELAQKHNIRRYGFHGASHRYLTERYAELRGLPIGEVNAITCHLGGSSSVTAIKDGRSLENSFGFSSLSGIPGSTRSGDIDPSTISLLAQCAEFTHSELGEMFHRRGGLLGVSGLSGDMRDLEEAASQGNQRARLAIDVYVHAVKKYIGAYLALLPKAEALLFAGGMGERSPTIRREICSNLEHLGIYLDVAKNGTCIAEERMISREDCRIQIWVIPTNEEIIVAREVYKTLCAS